MADNRRLGFLLFVVLIVTVSVGIVAGIGLVVVDGTDGDVSFGDNVSARLTDLEGLTATREVVRERGNETTRSVEDVILDFERGGIRARTLSGPGSVDVRVSNGSVLWLYDRDEQTVTQLQLSTPATANRLARLERFVDRVAVRVGRGTQTPTEGVGISPLPVVPAGNRGGSTTEPAAKGGTYTVSSPETTTVNGREAVVVRLAQPDRISEPVANYTQTLWLDTEWYYPLKQRTSWRQGGRRHVVTTTYRNVTFNPGVGASAFVFDPPAAATVEVPETPDQQTYETVAALRAEANLTVPDPAVPDEFVLTRATRTTGRVTSIGLRYVNASSVLTVAKLSPSIEPRTDGETVVIGGQQATYRNLGPRRVISWSCDGILYKVGGSGVSRDRLVSVANSVACK